jgi:hypothetical protein
MGSVGIAMFEKILQILAVKCRHKKISQPFTAAAAASPSATTAAWDTVGPGISHYVVCLECGKKFNYDWASMRIVR